MSELSSPPFTLAVLAQGNNLKVQQNIKYVLTLHGHSKSLVLHRNCLPCCRMFDTFFNRPYLPRVNGKQTVDKE
jgi:hypothetical protein